MFLHSSITISRTYGSGGRVIGRRLSEIMEIPYYDRNLIYLASNNTGIDLKYFAKYDEDMKRKIFDDLVPSEKNKYVSREEIFMRQAEVIRDVADDGDCVIVGRCADYILKKSGHRVLKIFIYANEADCIESIMSKLSVSKMEASKIITQINKYRSDYYTYQTGNHWMNAKNYDMCINMSEYSPEKAVKAIIGYSEIFRKL